MDEAWHELVKSGADRLIREAARTSHEDPRTAISQLIVAGAAIARLHGISEEDFRRGVELGIRDVYDAELHPHAPSTRTRQ